MLSPIQIGLKAAQDEKKFALILVSDNHGGDLESSAEPVLRDRRLGVHIVYVSSTTTQEPDALKIAALVSDTLPPTIPVLVLITPTAQGFSAVGGISGTPAALVLRQWLIGKMCGVLGQHLAGAPPMDADLNALCQPIAPAVDTRSMPSAGSSETASETSVQFPLSRTETSLSRLTRETPHVAGTWKGTAQKIICGEALGTAELVLTLSDTGYKASNSALVVGNVMGNLSVDGAPKGAFGADYGDATLQSNPFEQSFANAWTPLDLHSTTPQFHRYVKLTAKDAWAGIGLYQTLDRRLRRHSLPPIRRPGPRPQSPTQKAIATLSEPYPIVGAPRKERSTNCRRSRSFRSGVHNHGKRPSTSMNHWLLPVARLQISTGATSC